MTNMVERLERLANGPKPFVARMAYADGTVDEVAQPHRNQAERIVARYHVGREYQLRNADLTVRYSKLISAEVVSA